MAIKTPVTNESLQHWIKFLDQTSGTARYYQVTEDTSASTEREAKTYEPTYIDRKNQPKYNIGRTDTLTIEIDAHENAELHAELVKREDILEVPIEYVRTLDYDFTTQKRVSSDKLIAKHAAAKLSISPLSVDDVKPLKIAATITISDDYDLGTFDATSGTYTATTTTTSGSSSSAS